MAAIWIFERACLKLEDSIMSSVRSGETVGRKCDWWLDRMKRMPDEAVAIEND